jgi:hypothetical protein
MPDTPTPPTLQEGTEILDSDWLAAPSRRSRTRLLLLGALAVLLVFFAGVQVQKHWGSDSGSLASAAPNGLATGGFGAFPASGLSGRASSSTGTNGSTGTATPTMPAVIGTVSAVHGHTWTVEDLGGHSHAVKVTGTTTLTRPMADSSAPVHHGATVTVQGKTRGHTITATAITVR